MEDINRQAPIDRLTMAKRAKCNGNGLTFDV